MNLPKILSAVFDAILPRRERQRRTEVRTLSDIPLSPTSHELLDVQILSILDYREPAVEDLIRSLKYDQSGHAAQLCAHVLADFLREEIASARAFSKRDILLVPMPFHASRIRERGFNQVENMLRRLSSEFHDGTLARIETRALARTRNTKSQTRLSRKERLRNVENAFELTRPHAVQDIHVFLIDDVATTGATLVEAAKPLTKGGAAVTLIALARA